MRDKLIEMYHEYYHNYDSYMCFAEQNGLTEDECLDLLDLCNRIMSHPDPEA